MVAGLLGAFFVVLLGLVWLGIIIYLLTLAMRFVKAVERIADKLEGQTPTVSLGS
jgi:hypothetical protein